MSTEQDVATRFEELHRGVPEYERQDVLTTLVAVARELVPGCAWAGVTEWNQDGYPGTAAGSCEIAVGVDRLQYATGEGPCLSAWQDRVAVWMPGVARETRWPRFVAGARRDTPLQGAMSFPVPGPYGRFTLNLYTGETHAFDQAAWAVGRLFAAHARVLLEHAASTATTERLRDALIGNRRIGQAAGILAVAYRVPPQVALKMLRRTSSERDDLTLRDLADQVVREGRLPPPR